MGVFFNKDKRVKSREGIIYDIYHKRLYYTSLRILNNSMEAEEVMHDTLLKYFAREEIKDEGERIAWLKRVCINNSIDLLRKRTSERNMLLNLELNSRYDENFEIEEISFNGISVNMVKDALSVLAEGYKLIITLILFEGYDYEETAQILGIKEVSVRSQFMRAKNRLIEEINKNG